MYKILDIKKADVRFIKYYIDFIKLRMQSVSQGTTQDNLSLEKLLTFDILTPPLGTQRKIAAVLSAYDDLIENNTRRIAILEEMAQALYREWFVYFRFPGRENVEMVETENGQIPEGWAVVKLEDIASVNSETLREDSAPETIRYINISSVSTGMINQIELMKFANAPGRARRIVKHGDIIWSMVRPNRKSFALIVDPEPNTIASTGFAVISAKRIPFTYLYHAVTTDDFVGYLTNHATGAAYPAVVPNDFKFAKVLKPPSGLLEAFDKIVTDMLELKDNLLKKNTNLRQTRDLLLPRLISGELDVSQLNIEAPDN